MRYLALCSDYDGTIAHHGLVDEPTLAALKKLRVSGRSLVLVTGRELEDLQRVFPQLELFERIVAENGAMVFHPATKEERLLGERPPAAFIEALRARGVEPLSVGRVIVATWEPHEQIVLETIREQGLELQVIFNKGAVMILPAGINKATGLIAALEDLNLSPHNAVGVGDAENDHAFLNICECAVAVANALPAVKDKADFVTLADHGAGVVQLIDEMLADDLAGRDALLLRHYIGLGVDQSGSPVSLSPYSTSALVVGASGGGKSTVAVGLIERLQAAGYSFCIIDPEGDYDGLEAAVALGGPDHAPSVDECMQLLSKPDANAVINLLGIKLNERPRFFMSLLAHLRELRVRTGRPHWIIVDEAHHVLPANFELANSLSLDHMQGLLLVSVMPGSIAAPILHSIDSLMVLGDKPKTMLQEFALAVGRAPVEVKEEPLAAGVALLWRKNSETPQYVRLEPSRTERRRHLRKYAEGELSPERSFYFRGPQGSLNLRAYNLMLFLELADGVDADTWLFHLRRGDYARWTETEIKDQELAAQLATVEGSTDANASRAQVRRFIEAKYTLPATPNSQLSSGGSR